MTGRSDGTADVAGALSGDEPRVTLIRKENGAHRLGAEPGHHAGRGPFIAPIDADDLWHPTKLEKQVDARTCCRAGAAGFVYCFFRPIRRRCNLAPPAAPSRAGPCADRTTFTRTSSATAAGARCRGRDARSRRL